MEDTFNPKEDSTNDVHEILSIIEEDPEDSETEKDAIDEAETSLNDSDLYAGFDKDGNRTIDDT